MREILFKAKRIDNGEWVEGYYEKKIEWHRIWDEYVKTERHYICVNMVSSEDSYIDRIEVVPETICQYTGLTDKNGTKIWENDKVYIRYTDGQSEMDDVVQVRYQNGCFTPWIWQYECDGCDLRCELLEVEVIGNIFDNPELVEGGAT